MKRVAIGTRYCIVLLQSQADRAVTERPVSDAESPLSWNRGNRLHWTASFHSDQEQIVHHARGVHSFIHPE